MFSIDFSSLNSAEILLLAKSELNKPQPEWKRLIWQFLVNWLDNSTKSIAVFTSGSTGKPKQIQLQKEYFLQSSRLTSEFLMLKKNDRALLCLPADKISGMMMLVRSISTGFILDCIKPSAHPLMDQELSSPYDFAAFTPMQFSDIVLNEAAFQRAVKIRKIILGGESMRYGLQKKIIQMSNEIYSTFGMTETISHIALKRLNGSAPDDGYKTLPGISVSSDAENHLLIHAPMLGHEQLKTKDLVHILSENKFEWLGRADNMINRGGVKIYPEQVEKHLQPVINHPYFVDEINAGKTEEKLILFIEASSLKESEKIDINASIDKLGKLCRPREIISLAEFTRTANGKINRRETVRQYLTKIS